MIMYSTPNKSCPRFADARESLLQQIDVQFAKITQIEYRIAQLRQSLNALTPVATLPVELMENIFLDLVCRHEWRVHDIPFCCLDCDEEQRYRPRQSMMTVQGEAGIFR